jgi:hypothetical protein
LLKLTRLIVGVDSSDSIKMFWILIALIAVILGYYKLIYPHSYWTRKGVVQTKPVFLFGHTWKAIFRRISAPELTDQLYNLTPNAR